MGFSFSFQGEGVSRDFPLQLKIRWRDSAGADVDEENLALGFPLDAREWSFTAKSAEVAETLTVPARAVAAEVGFRISVGKTPPKTVVVTVRDFSFAAGELPRKGIEIAASGPDDAGPVAPTPPGLSLPRNLVPNPTFEQGGKVPDGWGLEGDNRNGSASWTLGGAYSGRRALRINDRGPTIKSWERKPGDPIFPGGKPTDNRASAREEISARWVSDPVPAKAGKFYQTTAFYWFAGRGLNPPNLVNPVRLQFLDGEGRVLTPERDLWYDWFVNTDAALLPGWVFVPGQPVQAPEGTSRLRVVVGMVHAFHQGDLKRAVKNIPGTWEYVLVDNIAAYEVPVEAVPGRGTDKSRTTFRAAAAASLVPHVPSSPSHRPDSLRVEIQTPGPAGLILVPADQRQGMSLDAGLLLQNHLGDPRSGKVNYAALSLDGREVASGEAPFSLGSYGSVRVPASLPSDLPFGPYKLRYHIKIDGEALAVEGSSRMGLLPAATSTARERARMDYPFSLWAHSFRHQIGTPDEEIIGRLAEAAGMGKTWFGAGDIWFGNFLKTDDPAKRESQIEEQLTESRRIAETWRKYGVTPMGFFQPPHEVVPPEKYPLLREVIGRFVSGLGRDGIRIWRHGTEFMHGGVRELDRARHETGQVGGQGRADYLYWGRKGTVRQYWQEYFEAHAAAKGANPDCLFGPQVASDIGGNVLRLFFQVGRPDQIDIFGMNTYISAHSLWGPNFREFEKQGLGQIPVFASEYAGGNESDPRAENSPTLEHAASRKMVRQWVDVLSSFPTIFQLEMWGLILADDERSLTYKREIRAPYLAFANMTAQLGAGTFGKPLDVPGVAMYVRQRPLRDTPVAVLWSKGHPLPFELEIEGATATVVDLWGNRTSIAAAAGRVTVPVGEDPVYVTGGGFIRPAAGFGVVIDHSGTAAGRREIAVSITNDRAIPVSGTLELIALGPLRIADRKRDLANLNPGETRTLSFPAEPVAVMADRRVGIRSRFTVDGKTYDSVANLNFHEARKVVMPQTTDATPGTWADAELTQVANRADQAAPDAKAWKGPADLSAKAGFRWNEQNLHARFEVRDDHHVPPDQTKGIWLRDVIELLIDTGRTREPGSHFTMLSLGQFPGGPKVHRWDGPLPQGEISGARITFRRADDVSIYEATIPWKEISPDFQPNAGTVISLAWTLDDNDGEGTGRRNISWFSRANDKNAGEFGDIILVE